MAEKILPATHQKECKLSTEKKMMQLRFKQIAVGGPNGRSLFGLTDSGELYALEEQRLNANWIPVNMETPAVNHTAMLDYKALSVEKSKAN